MACGRTLFVLEELLSSSPPATSTEQEQEDSGPVFTPGRPICLWNHDEPQRQLEKEGHCSSEVDCFGRSPVYAQTSKKSVHIASKEQYLNNLDDESMIAAV